MIRSSLSAIAFMLSFFNAAYAQSKLIPDLCVQSRLCAMQSMLVQAVPQQAKMSVSVVEAASVIESCAKAGHPLAASAAGIAYEFGTGVKRDLQRAFEYYRKAANGGVVSSMGILADFYNGAMGPEFPTDLSECYAWTQVAKKLGDERTASRETLCRGITDAQREEGRVRAEKIHATIHQQFNSKMVVSCSN